MSGLTDIALLRSSDRTSSKWPDTEVGRRVHCDGSERRPCAAVGGRGHGGGVMGWQREMWRCGEEALAYQIPGCIATASLSVLPGTSPFAIRVAAMIEQVPPMECPAVMMVSKSTRPKRGELSSSFMASA